MRLVPSPEQQSSQCGANMAMAPTFARRAVVRRSPCKKGGARGEHTRRRAQASRIRLPIGPDKGGAPPPSASLLSASDRCRSGSWRCPGAARAASATIARGGAERPRCRPGRRRQAPRARLRRLDPDFAIRFHGSVKSRHVIKISKMN